jgi:hypothetical protein
MQLVVDLAAKEDDRGIRDLLARESLPGRIRVAFTREPDFVSGCAVTGDDCRVLVARTADGHVVGVACRSTRPVFLNGREQRIGYLGQLRIDRRFHGRWLVSRGFSRLASLDDEISVPLYLASIVEGNDEADGVLVTRPRRGFPVFREVSRYRTLALPVRGRKHAMRVPEPIARATRDDIPELVRFLRETGARRHFFPAWTEDALCGFERFGLSPGDILVARRDGEIAGTIALWDQSAYKQTVIRGYSGWLKWVAPVCLPRIGHELRSVYASLVCIARDDLDVFRRLLRAACHDASSRGMEYLLIGLDARDPLLPEVCRYRHYVYPSRLYAASWHAAGPGEALDARPTYVDIACL